MISRRHRHGEAWERIGVTDEGEPMYRIGWGERVLILFTSLLGVTVWVGFVVWCVS